MVIRNARADDVRAIAALIGSYARERVMLLRSEDEIFRNLANFFIAEDSGTCIACMALTIYSKRLSEICSLAVARSHHGQGVGKLLVEAGIERARALGIEHVFALTYVDAFFRARGFHEIDKDELPNKIWKDCLHCEKFPHCDEIALIRKVD